MVRIAIRGQDQFIVLNLLKGNWKLVTLVTRQINVFGGFCFFNKVKTLCEHLKLWLSVYCSNWYQRNLTVLKYLKNKNKKIIQYIIEETIRFFNTQFCVKR